MTMLKFGSIPHHMHIDELVINDGSTNGCQTGIAAVNLPSAGIHLIIATQSIVNVITARVKKFTTEYHLGSLLSR